MAFPRQASKSLARRHFLGIAAAATARAAGIAATAGALLPSSAQAEKGGKGHAFGLDNGRGRGRDHGIWGDRGGPGPSCFLKGTRIRTIGGEVRVEDLQTGDHVVTHRGEALPVRWIGRRSYRKSGSAWPESIVPIRMNRAALDVLTPKNDLYVSPLHSIFMAGRLVRAADLVNGITIAPGAPADRDTIEYFHILLASHEAIFAEGVPAETMLIETGDEPETFSNFVEYERLFGDQPAQAMVPFAPVYGARAHLSGLLRLGLRPMLDLRDPVQREYARIARRAIEAFA